MKPTKDIKYTIFQKLCIVFSLVMLPIFIIIFSIYRQGISMIHNEIIKSMQEQNEFFSDSLQQEFIRISTLQYTLTNNWDICKLSLFPQQYSAFEKNQAISNIADKLWAIQTSSRFVETINVFIPAIDTNISTNPSSTTLDNQRKLVKEYMEVDKGKFIYLNNQITMLSESPFTNSENGDNPTFLTQTTLSKTALNQFFDELSIYSQSNGFIFSPNWDMLVSHNQKDNVVLKIRDNIINRVNKEVHNTSQKDTQIYSIAIDDTSYTVAYTYINYADIVLVRYIQDDLIFAGIKKFELLIFILAIVSIVVCIVFSRSTFKMIHSPLKKLVKAFHDVAKGDLTVQIQTQGNDEFNFIYSQFDKMILKLHDLIEQVYKQKILVQNAQLKQLQSQINPHFLYNSFFILNKRIRAQDTKGALSFSQSLGTYFQYVTRNESDSISLQSEVEHAQNYCEIQHVRFSNRLTLLMDELPPDYTNILVPRLILQPICENTFEHVLECHQNEGILHMGFVAHANFLDIIIEDNGTLLTDESLDEMKENLDAAENIEVTGIINIHRRLKLKYSDDCGLFLSRGELGGLRVAVRILLDKENENVQNTDS